MYIEIYIVGRPPHNEPLFKSNSEKIGQLNLNYRKDFYYRHDAILYAESLVIFDDWEIPIIIKAHKIPCSDRITIVIVVLFFAEKSSTKKRQALFSNDADVKTERCLMVQPKPMETKANHHTKKNDALSITGLLLKNNALFRRLENTFLNDNRHKAPAIQYEYDKRFGVVKI